MRMLRRSIAVLLMVAVALVFGQLPAAAGKTVIQFWTLFTGPDGKFMESMVNQFNKENSDIEVRMSVYTGDQYLNKLSLGVKTGTAPDVAVLYDSIMPRFVQTGALEVLNDELEKVGIKAEHYAPLAWNAGVFNGKVYSVPLGVYALGFYWNKDLFRAAGLDPNKPPTNLKEFLEYGRLLTIDKNGKHPGDPGFDYKNVKQWGTAVVGGWQPRQLWQFYTTLFQNGGAITDAAVTRAAFNNQAGVDALQFWVDLIYKYQIAPDKVADPEMLFMTNQIAMHMNGPWMINAFIEKGMNFGSAPMPVFGKQPATWAGTHLLVLPKQKDTSRMNAALKFVNWLTEHSLEWAKAGQIPARLSVLESAAFKALPHQSAFAKQLGYIRFEPADERNNEMSNRLIAAIEDALLKRKTSEQAISDAAKAIDSILAK